MKVLVVGSGGREHALAWRLSRSPRVTSVASCPGNGGLAELGPCWSGIPIEGDFGPLLERIRKEAVDLVVIGPEGPLVDGLADRLRQEGISTFGPGREASRLEGSKAHAKAFMKRHGIPTARFEVVRDEAGLAKALEEFPQGA
ncbi:MAG: phosphoribosylamine--glycine ligase, partial [Planctomycetota bacterium]